MAPMPMLMFSAVMYSVWKLSRKAPSEREKNDTHILDQSEGDKERETSSLPERQEHCNDP